MSSRQAISTDGAPAAAGPYSQAIRAGDLVFTAGQLGVDPATGEFAAPDVSGQAERALGNLAAILDAAGMAVTDIVSVTTYVVVGHELGPVMAARDAAFAGHVAASTLVTVPALARPEWQVEVAVVAVSPGS